MTSPLHKFVPLDPHAERRRLLVEVYDILIELAEEAEEGSEVQSTAKEKTTEPAPVQDGWIIALLKSNIPHRR
jgi:hypothetical protein